MFEKRMNSSTHPRAFYSDEIQMPDGALGRKECDGHWRLSNFRFLKHQNQEIESNRLSDALDGINSDKQFTLLKHAEKLDSGVSRCFRSWRVSVRF